VRQHKSRRGRGNAAAGERGEGVAAKMQELVLIVVRGGGKVLGERLLGWVGLQGCEAKTH